jgi:catechol 2,3-dioxygenase-like lactoylglutathione lyase family enzyme
VAIHHLAVAVRDLAASHAFYTEAMGFELVHAEAGLTDDPTGVGWAKHVFYDTGGGTLLALWDLHDARVPAGPLGLSAGMGLPTWVNHVAFDAGDLDGLTTRIDRWLHHGLDVLRIDHGWTMSAYTDDPDGNLVEWCASVRSFGPAEADAAREIVAAASPALQPLPSDIELLSPAAS